MRRVVVTGMGLLTSLGFNVKDTWNNILACKSGINKITKFNTDELPCKIAGFISEDSNDKIYSHIQNIIESKELLLRVITSKSNCLF